MSKHERQHSVSHVVDTRIGEVKRARVANMNITDASHTDKDDKNELSTGKILISNNKKALE